MSSLAAVLGLVLVLGTSSGAAASPTTVSYAGLVRIAIDGGATFPDPGRTARANQFVILHSWEKNRARELKAASPDVKVLAYKNLSFVTCDAYAGGQYVPQGVRCPDVNANHPDWFLTDPAGNRLNSSGYPSAWLLDVGNQAYQDAWANGVITEALADGWDGVFMDDTNPTIRNHIDPARVARYPSDSTWGAATRSMLANVGPRIRSSGLLAIANVCCARDQGTVWKDWLPYLSGAMDEMFTKWGNDPATGYVWDWGAGGWSGQLEEVREAEAQGKYFLGVTHSQATDGNAAAYGLTTMLLASQGRSSFALAQDYTSETRFPLYDRALLLGVPSGAYYRVGAAYRRQFTAGTVVVNPSLIPVTVALGAEYLNENGTRVTSLTLGATRGSVLLAPTGQEPPPPPPPPEDTVPPETTITGAPSGNTRSGSASFSFTANEASARFQCRLDGGVFAACTTPTTYTGLVAGTHSFAVRAIDLAGNVDASPATHSWRARPPKGASGFMPKGASGFMFTSGLARTVDQASSGALRGVSLQISGRVPARFSGRPVSRVTLYQRTARGWRAVARVRTRANGRFRMKSRVRSSARLLRLRAVATSSGLTVRSRVVVVPVRSR